MAFGLQARTWCALLLVAIGGSLLNRGLGAGAIGYYLLLILGLLAVGLTDRDRFYGADLRRDRRLHR